MKHRPHLFLFALLLLLLSACGDEAGPETRILVSIQESEGFTVKNNGQYIQPGESVEFLLNTDYGFFLVDTDYDGVFRTAVSGRQTRLTLENVQYPTRVSLKLTDFYEVITYEPNGGTGETATVAYDTTFHLRPNTSIGTDLFSRAGYTLTGWNTSADGTGERVGLGSRVSISGKELTLYAQWVKWSDEREFDWVFDEEGIAITGYHGNDAAVVVPALIGGTEVTVIAVGAFQNCTMTGVVLPATLKTVEDGAFRNCALETLTLSDNIESIGDGAFTGCEQLKTLRINAVEKPFGANTRRESCYADKVDLLILAQGEKKIVFYGGCSIWYNLDSSLLSPLLDQGYRVVNLGLNGVANSSVQMQILGNYLEDGDILFHTPELSSSKQLLSDVAMEEKDDRLWSGLEYNYDLFALVDLRTVPGALDSFCGYLSKKGKGTSYAAVYRIDGNLFWDEYGCIPFYREQIEPDGVLPDRVYLDPTAIDSGGMARLKAFYDDYQAQGVRVYLSYACVNMDDVPVEQRGNVELMDSLFRKAVAEMDGPVLISSLEDFLYHRVDFYDTNYHLLSEPARNNTAIWLRDLRAQMERDGLWKETP